MDDVNEILKNVLDKEPFDDVDLIEYMRSAQIIAFKYHISNFEAIDFVHSMVLAHDMRYEPKFDFYEDGRN